MQNRTEEPPPGSPMPRWPLLLIGAPAAVAIWSGWVGLGGLCGFGPVNLLPGIGGGFHLNTAICLPVGVEAFAGYALAVWLRSSPVPDEAREFAKRSAIGALALGMLGQIAFHVLSSLHVTHAPIGVVVAVSCMPVAVVGLAASLAHLMSRPPVPLASVPASAPASAKPPLPSLREIQARQGCGQETAKKVRAELVRFRDVPAGVLIRASLSAPAGAHLPVKGRDAAGATLNGHGAAESNRGPHG